MKHWKIGAALALGVLAMVSVGRLYDPTFVESQAFTDRTGIATANVVGCGTTNTIALGADVTNQRNYVFLQNQSDGEVLVQLGATASTSSLLGGLRLGANGVATSTKEWAVKVPINYISCVHFATVAGATKGLFVIEGRR